ncbi:MAG: DeoR/GlpR family DNA-binding transcription regulator [Alkalispirochaeta sp.]|jgi:DeoR family deoxyribose operon repressor
MKKADRKQTIVELLQRENGLPVRVIAEKLKVSHMTVRRDVEELVADDLVRNIHGGVILSPRLTGGHSAGGQVNGPVESPYSLHTAGTKQPEEKRVIGLRAVELIEDGDTLIIDSGSTTEFLAMHLPEDKNLTVLSYALNIITQTVKMERVRSVFAGGVLHQNTLMFESPEGLALIRRFRAAKAFISAAGVSLDLGVTCMNAYERESKEAAIESAAERILLVDSTKFGVIRSEYFADVDRFDTVVSDSGLDGRMKAALQERGIRVILA